MNSPEQAPATEQGASGTPACQKSAGAAILVVLIAIAGLAPPAAAAQQQPTLAVVATDKSLEPLGDLLTAQLSQDGVQLVERQQLDAVLQEQALSASGLTDRATLVKVGRLVRADAFVLLSLEKGQKGSLLRVRVAETGSGARLMDSLLPWDPTAAQPLAGALAGKVKDLAAKLALPPGQVVAVAEIPLMNAWTPLGHRDVEDPIRTALTARLSANPRIIVMEREDLYLLLKEKALARGEQGPFRGSALLIGGAFRDVGKRPDMELTFYVHGAQGMRTTKSHVTVMVSADDPAAAGEEAAEQLAPMLTAAVADGNWDPEREAAEFYDRVPRLGATYRPEEALVALQTAHALAPANVEYATKMHSLEFLMSMEKLRLKEAKAQLADIESCLAPLMETSDVAALVALVDVLPVPSRPFFYVKRCDTDLQVARLYCSLLERVADALESGKGKLNVGPHVTMCRRAAAAVVDLFRTRLSELRHEHDKLLAAGRPAEAAKLGLVTDDYLDAFEPLRSQPVEAALSVRMLLRPKDWPLDTTSAGSWRVRWRDHVLWIARLSRERTGGGKLALVGLDARAGRPVALWTMRDPLRRTGPLAGVVLGGDHCYVAVGKVGLVEFPGVGMRGEGVLDCRLLGARDGLPASPVTAVAAAGDEDSMWVAFGAPYKEGGLGLYNARTGEWRTFFSQMEDGRQLWSGRPCRFSQVLPDNGKVVLQSSPQTALWVFDPASEELRQVAQTVLVGEAWDPAGDGWLRGRNGLLHVDARQEVLAVELASSVAQQWIVDHPHAWKVKPDAFAPAVDAYRLTYAPRGGLDLGTAAVHGDHLWARCGQTRIAVLRRGQKLDDAIMIVNDILDGEPVLRFIETPYGLLAVGDGCVGIIEDPPDW